jgi:hypothetical protein
MSTVAPSGRELKKLSHKVHRFDAVFSFLSALILVAFGVLALLGASWLSDFVWKPAPPAIKVDVVAFPESEGDGEEGMSGDNPELGEGNQDSPDVESPADESVAADQSGVPSVMSQVLDAIGESGADLPPPVLLKGVRGSGRGGAPGGTGLRGAGEGSGHRPRALRWSIAYGAQSPEAYAQQLDHFGIELGVVRGGKITYVSNFSKGKPSVQQGAGDEKRLYFSWTDPARRAADAALLKKANIPTEGAAVVQFFPGKLENELARLEKEYQGKDPAQIDQTRFAVRRTAQGYEFYVVSQSSSKGPTS